MSEDDLETRIAVVEERLEGASRALHRSEAVMDKRLQGMNEFREHMREQQNTFLTKEEFNYVQGNIVDRLSKNTDTIATLQSARASSTQAWIVVGGVISSIASVSALIAVLLHFK